MRHSGWAEIRRLAVTVGVLGVVLAGCGGGSKGSSTTGSSATTAALKRLEVQVVGVSTAQGPSTVVGHLAALLGWPTTAEAGPGVAGCTVTAVTSGVSAITDADGRAVLVNVLVGDTVTVACTAGPSGSFVVTGPAGGVVTVKVEVEPGKVEVKAKDQKVSPATVSTPSVPSAPSEPSEPSTKKSGQS